MRIIETKVYTYSELSEKAKERARDWWREGGMEYDWWQSTYEDFETIAGFMGWTIGARDVHLMNGKTRQTPAICFSGFWSQGDGACFEGSWKASDVNADALRAHAPVDSTLHMLADRFAALAKTEPTMSGSVKQSGHYSHSGCTVFDWTHENEETAGQWDYAHMEREFKGVSRALMDWLYSTLEKEYKYLTSDEQVAENIEANEYEFTEEGKHV